MKKILDIVFITAFLLLLTIPYSSSISGFSSQIDNTERRTLASFPKISFSGEDLRDLRFNPYLKIAQEFNNFPKIIKEFNDYFDDHFGFRNILIRGYKEFKINILATNKIFSSVISKDGWIFSSPSQGSFKGYYDNLLFSESQLLKIKERLEEKKVFLEELGIPLIIVIAPEKIDVYPEHFPYKGEKALFLPYEQFIDYFKESPELNILDLKKDLMAAKGELPLYYKTDSHWNNLGTAIAYQSMMQKLSAYLPKLPYLNLKDIYLKQLVYSLWEGDSGLHFPPNDPGHPETYLQFDKLKKTIAPEERLKKLIIYGDSFAGIELRRLAAKGEFLTYFPELKDRLDMIFKNPEDEDMEMKFNVEKMIPYIRENLKDKLLAENLITHLLNFSYWDNKEDGLKYLLSLSFNKVIAHHIQKLNFDREEIKAEKPDAVIFEVVAPNSDIFLTF